MNELTTAGQAVSIGGLSSWAVVGMCVLTLIRAWPKFNEIKMLSNSGIRLDLFKRIELLEKRLDDKEERHSKDRAQWERMMREEREEFDRLMREEREQCDRRIDDLEGRIRQLQQQQTSYGAVGERTGPLSNELRRAWPPPLDGDGGLGEILNP